MKIWVLNNTKFDDKKSDFEYINNIFFNTVKKYRKPGDIFLHLGNIFNNPDNISTKLLNNTILLFDKLSKLLPLYILDGYDTELIHLLNYSNNIIPIYKPLTLNNVRFIPKKFNIINEIEEDITTYFINSKIDINILKTYDANFYCGFYNNKLIENNIIHVGNMYQFSIDDSSGFFVISDNNKHKYFENNISKKYGKIILSNIKQLVDFDIDYIKKNHIEIEIDKKLINDKKLKIDVLLNKFDFKSLKYINDDTSIHQDLIKNTSLKIETLILEKIKNSNNENLLSEFKNIMRIYNDRY